MNSHSQLREAPTMRRLCRSSTTSTTLMLSCFALWGAYGPSAMAADPHQISRDSMAYGSATRTNANIFDRDSGNAKDQNMSRFDENKMPSAPSFPPGATRVARHTFEYVFNTSTPNPKWTGPAGSTITAKVGQRKISGSLSSGWIGGPQIGLEGVFTTGVLETIAHSLDAQISGKLDFELEVKWGSSSFDQKIFLWEIPAAAHWTKYYFVLRSTPLKVSGKFSPSLTVDFQSRKNIQEKRLGRSILLSGNANLEAKAGASAEIGGIYEKYAAPRFGQQPTVLQEEGNTSYYVGINLSGQGILNNTIAAGSKSTFGLDASGKLLSNTQRGSGFFSLKTLKATWGAEFYIDSVIKYKKNIYNEIKVNAGLSAGDSWGLGWQPNG